MLLHRGKTGVGKVNLVEDRDNDRNFYLVMDLAKLIGAVGGGGLGAGAGQVSPRSSASEAGNGESISRGRKA